MFEITLPNEPLPRTLIKLKSVTLMACTWELERMTICSFGCVSIWSGRFVPSFTEAGFWKKETNFNYKKTIVLYTTPVVGLIGIFKPSSLGTGTE